MSVLSGENRTRIVCVIFCLFFSPHVFSQNIVINEFMASNGRTITDEDGDYSDWIELYNPGQDTVDLAGWGLSDNPDNPYKWVFPSVEIEPEGFLLVWASGKNHPVQGIMREVFTGIPGAALGDLIYHPDFPAHPSSKQLVTDYFEAPSNIGSHYGQKMHGYIAPPVSGDYTFWISSDDASALYLDFDLHNHVGVGSGSGTWNFPLASYYEDARTQTIYRAAEVGPANTFIGLALDVTGVPGQTLKNFTIRMKHTGLTAYGANPSWESSGWTVVYQADRDIHHTGWVQFNFAAPFVYNGTQNLMIDISFNNDSWTTDGSVRYSSLGGQRSLYYRTDSGFGDPLDWSGTENPEPMISSYAPNIRLITYDDTNVPIASVPDNNWTAPRQWNKFAQQQSQSMYLEKGQFYHVTALMKQHDGADHLAVRWQLPDGTIEEPIPVSRIFADTYGLHTNFSIAGDGEPLLLTRPDGTTADAVGPVAVPRDVAYGRTADGGTTWGFTLEPTPGTSNNDSTWCYEVLDGELNVSHQGGFYTAPIDVTMSYDDPDVTIYYTLDGSEPHPDNLSGTTYVYKNWYPRSTFQTPTSTFLSRQMRSYVYATPLQIQDRSPQAYQIAGINTQFSHTPVLPTSNIFKGTVVRARAFKEGAIPGRVETNTYFINPNIPNRYELPVISVVTDEDGLFDYTKGIYVAGKVGDDWRLANPATGWNEGQPANYNQRGIEWERAAHFEMFAPNGTPLLSQNIGLRVHGGWARGWIPKSLRLYARSGYGDTEAFDYPLFDGLEKRAEPGAPLTSFRRLILRNSGNDYDGTYFRDALMQELVRHLPLDTQAYRPVVHFINGEYWGIINMRERYDKYYLASHYNVDPEEVAILTFRDASVDSGVPADRDQFLDIVQYAHTNHPGNSVHYDWIRQRVDLDNLALYYAVQIYFDNTDWPQNNIDFWRKRTENFEPDAPTGHDGRWRWMLYDTDFGMSNHQGLTLPWVLWPWDERVVASHTNRLFSRLINNSAEFRNTFVNAMADNLNTSFKPERIHALVDAFSARLAASRAEHTNRWQTSLSTGSGMKSFATQRPAHIREQMINYLGLNDTLSVTVSRNENWGDVQVNSIVINAQTPGVNPAAPYPWIGEYYQHVPVTVRALPRLGYRFSHWMGAPSGSNPFSPTLTLPMTGSVSLTAVFEAPALMHYWSFNDDTALLTPTYTLGGAAASVQLGSATAVVSATGQDFAGENNRLGEPTGSHLRINNPLGATLTLNLPTTGYEKPIVMYETRRSGQGAGEQTIAYSIDGQTFTPLETITILDAAPVLHAFDFSDIAGTDNNPNFSVRIAFAQADGGATGNNRFDNLTLEAMPLPGTNQPPKLIAPLPFRDAVEESAPVINLNNFFADPDGDTLTFTAWTDKPLGVGVSVANHLLTLSPLYRGDAIITVQADDGVTAPIQNSFRVLVHPRAHTLREGDFTFGEWSPEHPEHTFPEHMLFLQSDTADPGVEAPLLYPYFIPHDGDDGYHDNDLAIIGFPYKTTGRTRLNGLDEDGISFINTGRQRDLGGAMVALDTTAVEAVDLSWLCQTLAANSRQYGIRVQYRIGYTGAFADVLDGSNPVEYLSGADEHTQTFDAIRLPDAAMGRPYVQVLWRYYHVAGTSGARAQIRLDDIDISVPRFPYGGQPRAIPGRIEAEEFDVGGPGRTYHDTTAGNSGGQFRPNANVDIVSISDGVTSGYAVTDIEDGEWLLYTVNSTASELDVQARVASTQAGGQIRVWLDEDLLATIDVPNTGSLTTWETASAPCLPLPDRENAELKLEFVGTGFRLNMIQFSSQSPYLGVPSAIPGRIEFENFDIGGQYISYYDKTPTNGYGQYRPDEAVDIQDIFDEDRGYAVYAMFGEWLEYTCNIEEGFYTIIVRTSSARAVQQQLAMSIDDQTLATFSLPITGGWSNFQNTAVSDVYLPGSEQVIRFTQLTSESTLNRVDFIRQYNLADITLSGRVDMDDFAVLAAQWLGAQATPSADIAPPGGDGQVNLLDLLMLAENWLMEE